MSVSQYTFNFGFRLIDFATDPYVDDEWFNWRLLDGVLSSVQANTPFINGTGTGAAYVADFTPDQILYVGMALAIKVPIANTGAVTLNVDGQGAKPIKVNGLDPASGILTAGMYLKVVYDGTNFNVVYPAFTALGSNSIIAGASGATAVGGANTFTVENSANVGMTLLSPNGTVGRYYFGSVAKPDGGGIVYDHSVNRLYLRANQYNGPYVDADKVIRQPDRTCISATQTYAATAQVTNGTVILFGTENVDVANNFDPTTGAFTVPCAGVYEFILDSGLTGSVAVSNIYGIYKNGTLQSQITFAIPTTGPNARSLVVWLNLAAADVVNVKMVTVGAASNLSGNLNLFSRLVS